MRFAIFTLKLIKNRDKANLDAGSPRLKRTFTCNCQGVREAFYCNARDQGIALSSVATRLMETCKMHDKEGTNEKADEEVSSTW